MDSASTTEVDDAISAEPLLDGPGGASRPGVRVWVHISDATRFVPLPHALDAEAARRGTSVYLPTGKIPMFPEPLAAGPMSLRPGVDCCALSVRADLSADGSVLSAEVFPSTIRVTYRVTYDDADELMRMALPEEPEWALLRAAGRARIAWRVAHGAIPILLPETQVEVQGAGVAGGGSDAVVRVVAENERQDSEARQFCFRNRHNLQPAGRQKAGSETAFRGQSRAMVQEMMVLAGEVAGRLGMEARPMLQKESVPLTPGLDDQRLRRRACRCPSGPSRSHRCRSRKSWPRCRQGPAGRLLCARA